MMIWPWIILSVALFLVFAFTFTNGMHDVSNILSTMITSGALSPRKALLLAACFELIGPLLGGTMVARATASFIDMELIRSSGGDGALLFTACSAVIGAGVWNAIMYFRGLPSSSTHALFGALAGAAVAASKSGSVIDWGIRDFNVLALRGLAGIAAALLISPILGFIMGYIVTRIVRFFLLWATPKANRSLKRLQIVTCSALAFSHASNATQKSMALTAMIVMAVGFTSTFRVTFMIQIFCAAAMTAGVLTGGRRVMKTVGRGIYKIRPEHGFEAQLASAMIILANSSVGGPVSSGHVVSASIMGVGTAHRRKAVRWGKALEILIAWVTTIPAAFLFGAVFYWASSFLGDVIGYEGLL